MEKRAWIECSRGIMFAFLNIYRDNGDIVHSCACGDCPGESYRLKQGQTCAGYFDEDLRSVRVYGSRREANPELIWP